MIRTQISLPPDLMEHARDAARRRGVSLAAVLREALTRWLDDDERRLAVDRAKAAVGGFHSGCVDTSERHDDALSDDARW
jgi:hypothetical protein